MLRFLMSIAVAIALFAPASALATNLSYDQVRWIAEHPEGADIEQPALVDSRNAPMKHLKVIQNLIPAADNSDRYIGVYDASLLGGDEPSEPMVAVSPDLVHWTWKMNLLRYAGGRAGSEPYIANAPNGAGSSTGGYVVAFEYENWGDGPNCPVFTATDGIVPGNGAEHCLRFLWYRDLTSLVRGRNNRDAVVPMEQSSCIEGTPSIESVGSDTGYDHPNITYRAHYMATGCTKDMEATGTLTSWLPEHGLQPAPGVDLALEMAMASGNHRDRDRYDATTYLYEASGSSGPQIYSYNSSTLSAQQLNIDTRYGAGSFASPTITKITDPDGDEAVLVTVNVLASPASGEVGELLYVRKIHPNLQTPARGAFVYQWYPENSNLGKWSPTIVESGGTYNSGDDARITDQVEALDYANVNFSILSHWGAGKKGEQTRVPNFLNKTAQRHAKRRVSLYYECEGNSTGDCAGVGSNPTVTQIRDWLNYVSTPQNGNPWGYTQHPNFAYKNGKPVIFVYADGNDGCAGPTDMVQRWADATNNFQDFYVVLKVFDHTTDPVPIPGDKWDLCSPQPSGWHQYGPATATQRKPGYFETISPGYDKKNDASDTSTSRQYLRRDLGRWQRNICAQVSHQDPFELITTFNELGEGSSTEDASEWKPYGSDTRNPFLQALHDYYPGGPSCVPPDPVLAAAGDINCQPPVTFGTGQLDPCESNKTSDLVLQGIRPQLVLTLGDNQYDNGAASFYRNSSSGYQATWGRFKGITLPALGNHEYGTSSADGYFDYWNNGTRSDYADSGTDVKVGQAGEDAKGWYYHDVNVDSDSTPDWRLIALNSSTGNGGGVNPDNDGCVTVSCAAGSEQNNFLRNALGIGGSPITPVPNCILAYWHHPRFGSSAQHAGARNVAPLWDAVQSANADLVLNGHAHSYERWDKIKDDRSEWNAGADGIVGNSDDREGWDHPQSAANGTREIVVGTGGKDTNHPPLSSSNPGYPDPQSQVYDGTHHGVLKLTLHVGSYDFAWLDAANPSGSGVRDSLIGQTCN
jgi:calcineurin-like phosphoesterase family protein